MFVLAAFAITACQLGKTQPLPCGGEVADAVDMGLSVKWASWNVGASSPEESGNFYAWGETEPKNDYDWSTYKHMQSGKSDWKYINKYQAADWRDGIWYTYDFVGDGKTVLDTEDDAAAANWGGDWVMPTPADWQELQSNCTLTWTKQNGVNGYLVTSNSNPNSIFLPAAGCRYDSILSSVGSRGYYLSSSLRDNNSSSVSIACLDSEYFLTDGDAPRDQGFTVRSICPSSGFTNGHDCVDLGLPSGKLWATCNVGDSVPEANGYYFAWGETEGKDIYNWSTYKHMQSGKSDWQYINKYQAENGVLIGNPLYENVNFVGDNKNTLEATDDAATVNWGNNWRMPTREEWEELYKNTIHKWTDDYNGTHEFGYILTSKVNGATIFLPAAGHRYNHERYGAGYYGYYWSSSLGATSTSSAWYVLFDPRSIGDSNQDRRSIYSIRPVCPAEKL